eukprot:gene36816-44659_t
MSKVNILETVRDIWDWLVRRESEVLRNADWIETYEAKYTALVLASLSLLFSFTHIFRHLKQYTMPEIQAIVVYSFFNLILEYGGGETDLVYSIENDGLLKLPWPLCCLRPVPRNARLIRFCHQGVLQFIMIKPWVALLDIVFISTGLYYQPAWQLTKMLVYNISYAWALYCLFVFYLAVKKVISQFRPIAKFSTVKTIIFATYYQSLVLQLTLAKPNTAVDWNNMLLIAEMVVFSVAFMFAFPVKEFEGGIPHRSVFRNVKEVFTIRDIMQNIYHNFMPEYSDYALQKSQQEIPSSIHEPVYMSGNLSRVAKEMAERYRGRSAKKSFNELLRGSNPITAKIRKSRQMQSFRSDSSHSSGDAAAAGDEESLIGSTPAHHDRDPVYSGLHSNNSHRGKPKNQEEQKVYMELRNMDDQLVDKSHLGKISLHIKSKAPAPPGKPSRLHISSVDVNSIHDDEDVVAFEFAHFPSSDATDERVAARSPLNKENVLDDADINFTSPKQRASSLKDAINGDNLHSPSLEWSEYVDYSRDHRKSIGSPGVQ